MTGYLAEVLFEGNNDLSETHLDNLFPLLSLSPPLFHAQGRAAAVERLREVPGGAVRGDGATSYRPGAASNSGSPLMGRE